MLRIHVKDEHLACGTPILCAATIAIAEATKARVSIRRGMIQINNLSIAAPEIIGSREPYYFDLPIHKVKHEDPTDRKGHSIGIDE